MIASEIYTMKSSYRFLLHLYAIDISKNLFKSFKYYTTTICNAYLRHMMRILDTYARAYVR